MFTIVNNLNKYIFECFQLNKRKDLNVYIKESKIIHESCSNL